jgi:hypothetical protein
VLLIVQLQIYLHHTLLQVTWVAVAVEVVLVVQLVPLVALVERQQLLVLAVQVEQVALAHQAALAEAVV